MPARRILVTGAAGFVGSSLVRVLAEHGASIVAVDLAEPATPAAAEHVAWQAVDLAQPGFSEMLPAADAVVHLAASPDYRSFPDGAASMFRIDLASTFELLEWARAGGASRFVHASTGTVYADVGRPAREDDPTQAASFYAAVKRSAEDLVRQYAVVFEVLSVRLFTPYGPGQRGKIVPDLVERVRAGRPVQVAGGTGPVLSPTFVDDVAAAMCELVLADAHWEVPVLNLAAPEVLDVRTIAGAVGDALGVAPTFEEVPGAAPWVAGDGSALATRIGKHQWVSFAEGIRRTLAASTEGASRS